MNEKDRRQYPRIVSSNLVSFVCLDEGGGPILYGMGKTLDVNQRGILLETFAEIAKKGTVSLAIGLKDETLLITGHVAHQRRGRNGKWKSGIVFDQTDEKTLSALNGFIAAFRAEARPARAR